MTTTRRLALHLPLSLGLMTLALSACGGGDTAAPLAADPQAVPATAMASVQAFSAYTDAQASLTTASNDSDSPMTMPDVAPPTSETDEPLAVS
jgi:hypothetical protein